MNDSSSLTTPSKLPERAWAQAELGRSALESMWRAQWPTHRDDAVAYSRKTVVSAPAARSGTETAPVATEAAASAICQ